MTRIVRELLLWAGAALGMLAVAAGVAVAFFGYSFLIFRSGSMSPGIPTGSVALARHVDAADIGPGDIVSVKASNGERVTHRVVSTTLRGDEATLVLKGDANKSHDSEVYVVTSADRVVASVPKGGFVLVHALTPPGLLAMAALSAMLILSTSGRADDDEGESDPTDDVPARAPAPRRRGARHRAPRSRARTVLVAGVVLACFASVGYGVVTRTTGTWASFTDRGTSTIGSFTSARYFSCDGVPKAVGANAIVYYKLDETGLTTLGGSAADSSGNGRTGTYSLLGISGGAARACAHDTGTAVTLDGVTSAIAASASQTGMVGPDVFTISIWFKTTTTRGGELLGFGSLASGSSPQVDRMFYMLNNGKVNFGVSPKKKPTVVSSSAAYNDGAWHMATATLSSAGMKLYMDGALVASDPLTTSGEDNPAGFWRIGYDNLGDGFPNKPASSRFAGTVDEAFVLGTALSDADVAAAYLAAR